MSASPNAEVRQLLCEHCHEEIQRDSQMFIWVVSKRPEIGAPFACRMQRADFLVGDDEIAFGSIACIKKWLLAWVDLSAAEARKAGRA